MSGHGYTQAQWQGQRGGQSIEGDSGGNASLRAENDTGVYTIRGQTYLEGKLHEVLYSFVSYTTPTVHRSNMNVSDTNSYEINVGQNESWC